MAFLPGVASREVKSFGGSVLTPDPYTVPPEQALLSQNVEYVSSPTGVQVKTRFGHSGILAVNEAMTVLQNWLFDAGTAENQILYFKTGVGVRLTAAAGVSLLTIMTQVSAAGMVIVSVGQRLYASFYTSTGAAAAGGGQVYTWLGTADPLFLRAPKATEVLVSVVEGGVNSGSIIAGVHRMGFYLTTRNGYSTRLAPLDAGLAFLPFSFTASGNRTATFTFTPQGAYNWPLGARLTVVMTTTQNLNRYLTVPIAPTFVFTNVAISVVVDTTDSDINADGTDATLQQTVVSQDGSGNPPFAIQSMFTYGNRMGYIGLDPSNFPVVYFSEPSSPQLLTIAQHGVYLPGNLPINAGLSLRGVAYLFGSNWTYAATDNGQTPATWAQPQLVDGVIGAPGPYCVAENPAQGFAWVANQGGLYLFQGGMYPARPVSFFQQTDWAQINWSNPNLIFVVDDKDRHRVRVYCPFGASAVPNKVLTWYYTDGTDPETVHYTIDDFSGIPAMVQNPTTRKMETWVGSTTAGPIVRCNDGSEANPYRDVAAAIDSRYRLGGLPDASASSGTMYNHHADEIRVVGSGHMNMTVFSLDSGKSVVPAKMPLSLSGNPGKRQLIRYAMMSEQVNVEITNNAEVDANFQVSGLSHSYTPSYLQR